MNQFRSIHRLALAAALAGAALGATPALSSAALPQTCLKDGVCFTKAVNGTKTNLTITGTAGADNIVVAHVPPFSNNVGSGSISVDGKDAHVNEGAGVTIVVNALGGDDHVTEKFPTTTQPLYGTSTVDGGAGNDVIAAAFRADVLTGGPGADALDGGAGNDQLLTRDGERDTLHGGLGTDSAQSDLTTVDTIDGVESVDAAQVGRLQLMPRTVTADARKWARMTLRWTHPNSWRELRRIQVRLYRGDARLGTIDVRPQSRRLSARGVEIMANRSLLTRSDKTVTARLGMKFPRSLAGTDIRVAVEATDVHGHTQLDPDAGRIRVAR
jgi:hypothetical protein